MIEFTEEEVREFERKYLLLNSQCTHKYICALLNKIDCITDDYPDKCEQAKKLDAKKIEMLKNRFTEVMKAHERYQKWEAINKQ